MVSISRRTFLCGSALTVAANPARPIRLGGPIFLKADDPRDLAREHRRLGYGAAYCPNAKPSDTDRVREIEKAFQAENVIIAEVGAWVNMLDPDPEKRRANLRYVIERLTLAELVGARCCVDIAGSYNPKVWYGPHPKNISEEYFHGTVENCRRVIDEVKPKRTKFTIEMSPWCLPDGPDEFLRLLRAVDRSTFGVHLDICNIINSPRRLYGNSDLITDCFRKLGPWIASCHAKDIRWVVGMQMYFEEGVPGRGELDYRTFLRELSKLPVDAPLMLEHLKTPEEYEEGKNFIRKVGAELGLTFA